MNAPDSDERLHDVLGQWRLVPPANPNFRPAVWARIHRDERTTWLEYVRSHAGSLALVAVVTLFASGWVGHAAGRAKMDAARDAMVVSYLVDLDPRVQASLRR
jgi:hypothetical protein